MRWQTKGSHCETDGNISTRWMYAVTTQSDYRSNIAIHEIWEKSQFAQWYLSASRVMECPYGMYTSTQNRLTKLEDFTWNRLRLIYRQRQLTGWLATYPSFYGYTVYEIHLLLNQIKWRVHLLTSYSNPPRTTFQQSKVGLGSSVCFKFRVLASRNEIYIP